MKRILSVFLALILALSLCAVGVSARQAGRTYYVDALTGEDSNDGLSPESAWRTVAKASSMTYSAGDSILLKAGEVHTGAFIARGDGTAESPITLGAYGDVAGQGRPLVFTRREETLITLNGVSGWTVENLELTAPEGKGILIAAYGKVTSDITVRDCSLHDIWYHDTPVSRGNYAAVYIVASGVDTRIENLTLSNLDIYNCAYAIHMGGNTIEWLPETFVSPEVSYSQNLLFDSLRLTDILYDGMAICSVNNLTIRNCALIRTSLNTDYCTAPLWMHHAKNVTVECCEIAGATNYKDGMAVDFDGWTTDSTYQYVYSHDNVRFMQNCIYDDTTRNRNCTVRYCLSVNDNVESNNNVLLNSSSYTDDDNPTCMENFRFYNNTIVNSLGFTFSCLKNSFVMNNIFAYCKFSEIRTLKRYTTNDENGKFLMSYMGKYDGVMSNNCFYEIGIPTQARSSVIAEPMFASDDWSCASSFALSSASPLIGAGAAVPDEDMGTRDFFGNPVTAGMSHNIGCYEGAGVENDRSPFVSLLSGFFIGILSRISGTFWTLLRASEYLRVAIDNL